MASVTNTRLIIRVIARGGKFLGNDIGGALITVRDAQTGELLHSGQTQGGSGPKEVMSQARLRTQPIPTVDHSVNPPQEACHLVVDLPLTRPRLLEITAYGPQAAPQGAHTVTATHWIYPGLAQNVGDGLVLEIPGLLVQILNPPTHFLPDSLPNNKIDIRANVTMMCGCPITPNNFWPPSDFIVRASIVESGAVVAGFDLDFDTKVNYPSQYVKTWNAPAKGIYELAVVAYQISSGNTGVNTSTFIVP